MTDRTTEVRRVGGSFHDPSGFLYERDGVLLRQVDQSFASGYDRFISSGCYDALVAEGLLVEHHEVGLELAATPRAHRVLAPRRLPFVAYPYEWSPAQRREAALLTLRCQDVALDHGLALRDASAFNVQFDRGRPIFIDSLSFGPYIEGDPWVAYRQFCQHFVAPLALETLVDARLAALLRGSLDGIPLDLAAALLPARSRLRPGLLLHIHGQARASRTRPAEAGQAPRTARFSERAMRGLIQGLRGLVEGLRWNPGRTAWSAYYEEAGHYAAEAMDEKLRAVGRFLDRVAPGTVWDLGANTGRFARMAAERGAHVVAFDSDYGAVERGWLDLESVHLAGSVLPLVLDLTNPSPALGWAHAERDSLADRGPADLVLALALVHHLAIGANIPLPHLAAYLAQLAPHLVVEWVPKEDPKVQVLLATREDVFPDYAAETFEAVFGERFTVLEREPLPGSGRVLYLMAARP